MRYARIVHCGSRPVCLLGGLLIVALLAPSIATAQEAPPAKRLVSFRFADQDAGEVLSALSQFYGVPFRATAPVPQPISLASEGQVDLTGAISLLETAVATQGLSVRREDGMVKVVQRSGMLATEIDVIVLKHSDPKAVAAVVVELFQTRDVLMEMASSDPKLMAQLLPYLNRVGRGARGGLQVDATPWPPLKAVIVKAPKQVMPLIREFILTKIDAPAGEIAAAKARAAAEARKRAAEAAKRKAEADARRRAGQKPPPPEKTKTFQPVFVKAEYIAEYCQKLKGIKPQVLPHNVVMHKTRKYSEFERIEEILAMLDVADSTSFQQYYIQLNHADASRVRDLLTKLYSFTLETPTTEAGAARLADDRPDVPPTLEADIEPEALPASYGAGEVPLLEIPIGEVTIVADTENNALIIRTIPANLKAIQVLITQIDRPRGQVLIDVFIAEIALDDSTELGVDFLNTGIYHNVDGGPGTYGVGQDFGVLGNTTGMTYSLISNNLKMFIRALKTSSRLDVISRPSVTTLDNSPATFEFGRQVPLIQASNVNIDGQVISSVIRYQSVTNKLVVTPHINEAGFVSMSIEQLIDDVSEDRFVISEQLEPQVLIKRMVKTNVRVSDGQTVFLGGFIVDRVNETESKVPFLGDIPYLGELFKSSVRSRSKAELLIFITPHILRTPQELLTQTNRRRRNSLADRGEDRLVAELDEQELPGPDPAATTQPTTQPTTRPATTQPTGTLAGSSQ